MSEHIPEGSAKQFGEDVADVDGRQREETPQGSGKQFADDVADVDRDPDLDRPEGAGKQFARGQSADPDVEQEP